MNAAKLEETPAFRVAAAARIEVIASVEKRGRIPDCAELARAIEESLRRELAHARLDGEIEAGLRYNAILREVLDDCCL